MTIRTATTGMSLNDVDAYRTSRPNDGVEAGDDDTERHGRRHPARAGGPTRGIGAFGDEYWVPSRAAVGHPKLFPTQESSNAVAERRDRR